MKAYYLNKNSYLLLKYEFKEFREADILRTHIFD